MESLPTPDLEYRNLLNFSLYIFFSIGRKIESILSIYPMTRVLWQSVCEFITLIKYADVDFINV